MQTEDCYHLGAKLLICAPDEKVLLLEKASLKGNYWDLPGGRVQREESVLDALQREVHEETGLKSIEGAAPFSMFLTKVRIPLQSADVGLILSVYRCCVPDAFTPELSSEHVSFGWFAVGETVLRLKGHYPASFIEQLNRAAW